MIWKLGTRWIENYLIFFQSIVWGFYRNNEVVWCLKDVSKALLVIMTLSTEQVDKR